MHNHNKIEVSVIIPVFNAEEYLVKCLDSVVNQTLENIEIIIIDDGSTDGSSEICMNYAAKDNRIIYYRKENEGLAAARQDGIERANGEYIGFVDSDDWLELNMYERMYSEAVKENADIVFCNCYFNDSETDRTHLEPGVYDRERIENEILPRSLAGLSSKGSNTVIRWSNCLRIYKLSYLKDIGFCFGRKFRRSQDLQLTFEATLYAQKYVSLNNEYLYHNRTHGNEGSLSRGYTKNYWNLIRPLIDKLYEDVENYKKQDLSDQMHLCAFFFAVTGVQNESKPTCPNDKKTKLKLIKQIINDPICERFCGHIPADKLSPVYRNYYELIQKKNASKILSFPKKFNRRQEFRRKFIAPVLNFLTETAIYKKIRGRKN